MPRIALSRIKVSVSERQREDVGDIEGLANSFLEFGQLQPILIDEDCNLVAGFRRLTAAAALGWDSVNADFVGRLTELRAEQIELEENIRRKQLTWQEEQKATKRIHELKAAEDPMWNADKTAALLGVSKRTVYNAIELSKAIEDVPDVKAADTAHGAMLRLKRHKQIEGRKEDAKLRTMREELGLVHKVSAMVEQGDAPIHMRALEAESIDMVITNPPYGVDIEGLFKGDRKIYSDDETKMVTVVREVVKEAFRILRPDRWFVMFYPTTRLEEGKEILHEAGFTFQGRPCIWYKPNKFVSALSNPYQEFSCQYETFFWARKGEPRFNRLRIGDVFVYDTPDTDDRIHPLQMPPALWEDIISIGTVTGEKIFEPFAGSGSGGVASFKLERNYNGVELDPEYVSRANMWISEMRSKPVSPEPKVEEASLLKELEFSE